MTMFVIGLVAALAILFLLFKLPLAKLLWIDVIVDVLATVALMVMFAGTFSGMAAAVIGGCMISIVLYAIKHTRGYERPVRQGLRIRWQRVMPHQ